MSWKNAKCDFCGAPFEERRKNAKQCAAGRSEMEGDEDGDAK